MRGNWARSVDEATAERVGERYAADARIAALETHSSPGTSATRSVVRMEVSNPTSEVCEYIGRIQLEPGVFVTNLWLEIHGQRVAGGLFESESVFWVYQRLTERAPRPQDPALLRYVGENQLELRVFPVPAHGNRVVEVEFLHRGTDIATIMGETDRKIVANSVQSTGPASISAGNAQLLLCSDVGLHNLKPHKRKPVITAIVDWSVGTKEYDVGSLVRAVETLSTTLPGADEFELTAVGTSEAPIARGLLSDRVPLITKGLRELEAGREGGFDPSRVVRWAARRHALGRGAPELDTFPAIAVITNREFGIEMTGPDLREFGALIPDIDSYAIIDLNKSGAKWIEWKGAARSAPQTFEVNLFRHGDRVAAVRKVTGSGAALVRFIEDQAGEAGFEGMQDDGRFMPILNVNRIDAGEPLARAATAFELGRDRKLFPSRNTRAVERTLHAARDASVLTSSASYVVFETETQWEAARRAEKTKLGDHETLPMTATPEPSTLALLGLGAGAILLALRIKREHLLYREDSGIGM